MVESTVHLESITTVPISTLFYQFCRFADIRLNQVVVTEKKTESDLGENKIDLGSNSSGLFNCKVDCWQCPFL